MKNLIGSILFLLLFAGLGMAEEATLLSIEKNPPWKASLNIEIPRKMTEEELRAGAKQIYKALRGSQYKVVFMLWYLPGMKHDGGAWASTNFNPNLEIRIMNWILESNPPNQGL